MKRDRDVNTGFLRSEPKQTFFEINGIPSKVCGVGQTQASEKTEKNQAAPVASSGFYQSGNLVAGEHIPGGIFRISQGFQSCTGIDRQIAQAEARPKALLSNFTAWLHVVTERPALRR